MADKETVIAALKCFTRDEDRAKLPSECKARNCPYAGTDCEIGIMEDALKLLEPPPKEYILRSDAIKAICENCTEAYAGCGGICDDTDRIRAIPAAEVEPIVYGEWEERFVEDVSPWLCQRYYCSACGDWQTYGKTPRCPYCGAHMKVEDE